MIEAIGQQIDLAAINGTGSNNQPLGILNTTGIGSVAIGNNGGAPTIDKLIDLKGEVAIDSADVATAGFLINAKTEKTLSKLKDGDGRYLLDPFVPFGEWYEVGQVEDQAQPNECHLHLVSGVDK